jgi:hypothetical protein
MTLSPELLNAIEAGCDGVTPGPWKRCAHLRDPRIDTTCGCGYRGGIWGNDGETLVLEMGTDPYREGWEMIPVATRDAQLRDAAHIARLDPATARELVAGYRRGLAGEEREREARAALAKVTEERDALARVRDGYLPDPSDPPALKDRDGRFADGYRCAQHDLHAWFAAWIKSRNDPRARIILHAAITNLGWAFARQRKRLHETRIHSTLEVPYVGRM